MKRCAVLVLVGGLVACTDGKESSSVEDDRIYWPEKDVESDGEALWEGMGLQDKAASADSWDQLVWLNFDGAEVSQADSFIIRDAGDDVRSIPPFTVTDLGDSFAGQDRATMIETVTTQVKALFSDFDLSVVTAEPAAGTAYTTVHIGGPNFTGRPNVLGTAPLDLNNFNGPDIVFVYAAEFAGLNAVDNTQRLANVVAHEVAHSLGARHIEQDTALMNAAVGVNNTEVAIDGNYPGEDGGENTKSVVGAGVGLKRDSVVESFPVLATLGMNSTDDVAQISVISSANVAANPDLNLVGFDYVWEVENLKLQGPSIRLRFAAGQQVSITLTATHKDLDGEQVYRFEVIRQRKSQL